MFKPSTGVALLIAFVVIGTAKAADDDLAAILSAAHQAVSANLKDPSSAQFRNESFRPIPSTGAPYAICGEVNAKNSYGGYVGFRPYRYEVRTREASVRDPDDSRSFDVFQGLTCKDTVPITP